MRSDLPELQRRLLSSRVGAVVGVLVCATDLGGFWTDLGPLMHSKARYWSGSWLALLHFGAFAFWGAAIGFAWQKNSHKGNFRLWGSSGGPFVEPEPDSQILLRRGLGNWGYLFMGLLLLMALAQPTLRWAIVGSVLGLLVVQRNYARWEIGTNGRFYLMHTFFSLQWFEDLKVFVPSRHLRPGVKGLEAISFRRAESLAPVGLRSDEGPYQVRRRGARQFATGVYLVACLITFGVYWTRSEVKIDFGWITALIGYSMLPWFLVTRSVVYATLPSGVENRLLDRPQPVHQGNLLIEVRKPGWTLVGCVATAGCLSMFGGFFVVLLLAPLFPIVSLLDTVKVLNPVAICLPWAVLFLLLFNRPKRSKWFELDLHDLSVIEHQLVREYQFSKPKSERAVALGIRPQTSAVNNLAYFPIIYLSNGESLPLAGVGVAKEVAAERAQEFARRMFLPVVPWGVGQSLVEGWIRSGMLEDNLVSSWPKVKEQNLSPLDEVPPLD